MKRPSRLGLGMISFALVGMLACGPTREEGAPAPALQGEPDGQGGAAREEAAAPAQRDPATDPEQHAPEPSGSQPPGSHPPAMPPPAMPLFAVAKLDGGEPTQPVHDLAWSADAARIASVSADGSVRLWDAKTWAQLRELPGEAAGAHQVDLSGDGARVLTTRVDEVHVYDGERGELLRSLKHEGAALAVAISADAKLLASGGADGLRIWTGKGKLRRHLEQGDAQVVELDLSDDGKLLASRWSDGAVRIIDPRKGKVQATIELGAKLEHLALATDGSRFVAQADDATANLYDSKTGEAVFMLPYPNLLALDAHANLMLVADTLAGGEAIVQIVDVHAREAVRDFSGHAGPIRAGVFSPDGLIFASASDDGDVLIWAAP